MKRKINPSTMLYLFCVLILLNLVVCEIIIMQKEFKSRTKQNERAR